MLIDGPAYRAQAVSLVAQILERLLHAELAEEFQMSEEHVSATKATLRDIREWELSPSKELAKRIRRTGNAMARAALIAKREARPDADVLKVSAASCFTVTRPAWRYWVWVASNAALDSWGDWGSCRDAEHDYQCLDLSRMTGRSLVDVAEVASWDDLDEEYLQPYEGKQVWFGPPLLGRPTQVIAHLVDTRDEESETEESEDDEGNGEKSSAPEIFGLRLWRRSMFSDVYVNGVIGFASKRQLLRAMWLINERKGHFKDFAPQGNHFELTSEQVSDIQRDGGESLPSEYTVTCQKQPAWQRGPLLLLRGTKVWQRQNLWGRDEFVMDVWERYHYRRLTINSLEAIFPSLTSVQCLAHNAKSIGCSMTEKGSTVDVVIPGTTLKGLLPDMFHNLNNVTGDDLLRLERELWARSGWLPPTR